MSESIYDTQELKSLPKTHHFVVSVVNQDNYTITHYPNSLGHNRAVREIGQNLMPMNLNRIGVGLPFIHANHMVGDIEGVPCHVMVMYTGEDVEWAFDEATQVVVDWMCSG